MPNLDIRPLRDEPVMLVGENKRHKRVEEEMGRGIIEPALGMDQAVPERGRLAP